MLEINRLNAGYGNIPVLFDFSCSVGEGEIVSIVGANGAGKSTLLKTVSGLLRPSGGEIVFMGRHINGLPAHKIARLGISLVPEGRQVFGELTVAENLRLGAHTLEGAGEKRAQLEGAMDRFPLLKPHLNHPADTLSVGEQQMLMLARGLMSRPRLLLVDELSFGLAPVLVEQLMERLREISRETTILLVDQNVQALEIAHRGYVIQNGRTVMAGSSRQLLDSEIVKSAYLGM